MEFSSVKVTLIIIYFFTVNSNAPDQLDITSIYLDSSLENFQHFNDKSYIGGTNILFVLNKDLSVNQTVSTCRTPETNCMNRNKVLVIDEENDELIVCGTGNSGLCEVRKTDDIETLVEQRSTHLKVSTDFQKPAQFMITQNNLFMVALTFGTGIDAKFIKRSMYETIFTYDYAISTRHLSSFNPVVASNLEKKALFLEIYLSDPSEYIVYYKALFQSGGYSYFLTNQKEYVGGSRYVSKLGRICQNDTGYSSYTDIVLQCLYNGIEYNLVQNAELIDVSGSDDSYKAFVSVFRSGSDPEAPSGDSVICMTDLDQIDEAIMEANKRHALSCQKDDYKKRYLRDVKGDTCLPDEDEFKEIYFVCERLLPIYRNVIGNVTVTLKPVYRINEHHGAITALHGTSVDENSPVVIIGTSTGKVLNFNLQNGVLELYNSIEIDNGSSIQTLYQHDDNELYVMSKRKVFKIMSTNCSEFKTCAETAAARNPLCGWCVYENRASRRRDCSAATNHWLMSQQGCVNMSIEPSSIPVSSSSQQTVTNVTLFVINLPDKIPGDMYMCRFKKGSETLDTFTAIEINETNFICAVPVILDHGEVAVELLVHSTFQTEVLLSSAQLMLYECRQFKRCGECVSLEEVVCEWCTETATCQSAGLSCQTTTIFNISMCPSLLGSEGRHFLPYGVPTEITVSAVNLPVYTNITYHYKCLLPEVDLDVPAAVENDSISCLLNIPQPEAYVKKDFLLLIAYGFRNNSSSIIDDGFGHTVTAYSCSGLAHDCSHCLALNTTRYQCDWCSNSGKCGIPDLNCTLASTCPAPNITKIHPENGSTKGGTAVTIYGSEFGSDISDVDKIQIGNVLCNLSPDLSNLASTENGDYSKAVPERLVCITRATEDTAETTGFVNITVNGLSSDANVLFTYKKPSFKSITPIYGPISGGTVITISGKSLGIGNRKVTVFLGGKQCLKPKLYPKTSVLVNSTIRCTVSGGYKDNITAITLYIDGTVVFERAYVSFVFISDPLISKVADGRGFISGGTKVVIHGTYLDHAHEAKLVFVYDGMTQSEECVIQSPLIAICIVPEAMAKLKHDLASRLLETVHQPASNDCLDCIHTEAYVHFDGVLRTFILTYFRDPVLHDLPGEHNIVTVNSKDNRLVIKGEYLTLAATLSDVNVTVGKETCPVVDLTATSVTCIVPRARPKPRKTGNSNPEVKVTIGNIRRFVGYLQYKDNTPTGSNNKVTTAVVSSIVGAVFTVAIIVGTLLLCRKYRKVVPNIEYLEMDKSKKKEHQDAEHNPVSKQETNAEDNASSHIYELLHMKGDSSEMKYLWLDGKTHHSEKQADVQTDTVSKAKESENVYPDNIGKGCDQMHGVPKDHVYTNTEDIQYYRKDF